MALTNGCNHVAVITEDLDRFIDFYREVFEAEVDFDLDEDGLRHAMVRLGAGFALHPFQLPGGSPHAAGSPAMFDRGHLDHLALDVADQATFEDLRARLVEAGASNGDVTDFGRVRSVSFVDPDGLDGEIAQWVDAPVRTFEERLVEAWGDAVTRA